MPEYKRFNWRAPWGKEYDNVCEQRRSSRAVYEELLRKALKTQLPKDKFVLRNNIPFATAYLRKLTSRHAFWTRNFAEAKIFRYAEDAEEVKKWFTDTENWTVEQIKTPAEKNAGGRS